MALPFWPPLKLNTIAPLLSERDITIEVAQSSKVVDLQQTLLWEILEQYLSWPEHAQPQSITVLRTMHLPARSGYMLGLTQQDLRVLLVTARPQGAYDVSHMFVSSVIGDVAAAVEAKDAKFSLTIEISRPGTFEAFQRHLGRRPKGYFHLVHFDVHGVERGNT